MSISKYVIIDSIDLKCINTALWDGVSVWMPGANLIAQLDDETIKVGDTVQLINNIYVYESSPPGPSAIDLFSVDQFVQDLLSTFSTDTNILAYYAVMKDLASFKNFSTMKSMIADLLSSSKVTQDEVNSFNAVLMNQNIDLSTF